MLARLLTRLEKLGRLLEKHNQVATCWDVLTTTMTILIMTTIMTMIILGTTTTTMIMITLSHGHDMVLLQ